MPSLGSRLARGEEAAFAELYDAVGDRLFRYLTARLGSRDRAADVVQATFVRAVERRKQFARVENPVGYLFQVARNEAARAAGREQRRPMQAPADDAIPAPRDDFGPDDVEVVRHALTRLDVDDREIVELKVYGGLTFQEIAQTCNLPQGTVATRYRRALDSLRPWLTKQFL